MKFDTLFNSIWDAPRIGGGHPFSCNCMSCQPRISKLVVGTGFEDFLKCWAPPTVPFRYDIEMPGTKKDSIKVKLKGETLNITWSSRLGEGKSQSIPLGGKYYDLAQLSCSYEDGLFKIYVPLKEVQPPKPPDEPEIDIEIK